MIDKNKNVIKYRRNVFSIVIEFLKNKFWNFKKVEKNKQNKMQTKKDTIVSNTQSDDNKKIIKIGNQGIQKNKKIKNMQLYNELKKGNVKIDDVPTKELIRFNILIKEEIKLKKVKIIKQEEDIAKLKKEIKKLKEENKKTLDNIEKVST